MVSNSSAKATITAEMAGEVSKVLDALSALAIDLSCYLDVAPQTLILSAAKTREACEAINEGVKALKTILRISEASGGGPIPATVRDQLEMADSSESRGSEDRGAG